MTDITSKIPKYDIGCIHIKVNYQNAKVLRNINEIEFKIRAIESYLIGTCVMMISFCIYER